MMHNISLEVIGFCLGNPGHSNKTPTLEGAAKPSVLGSVCLYSIERSRGPTDALPVPMLLNGGYGYAQL